MTERSLWSGIKQAFMEVARSAERMAETNAQDETRTRSRTPIDLNEDGRRSDGRRDDSEDDGLRDDRPRGEDRPTGDPRDPRDTGG